MAAAHLAKSGTRAELRSLRARVRRGRRRPGGGLWWVPLTNRRTRPQRGGPRGAVRGGRFCGIAGWRRRRAGGEAARGTPTPGPVMEEPVKAMLSRSTRFWRGLASPSSALGAPNLPKHQGSRPIVSPGAWAGWGQDGKSLSPVCGRIECRGRVPPVRCAHWQRLRSRTAAARGCGAVRVQGSAQCALRALCISGFARCRLCAL